MFSNNSKRGLDLYIRPLNVLYTVEGLFYDELLMARKIFSFLESTSEKISGRNSDYNFNMFIEQLEEHEFFNTDFLKSVLAKLNQSNTSEVADKIIAMFTETLNPNILINPYVLDVRCVCLM